MNEFKELLDAYTERVLLQGLAESKLEQLEADYEVAKGQIDELGFQLEQAQEKIADLEQSLAIVQEREATRDHPPKPESKPWYPDDSGEWVEVQEDLMAMPPELNPDDKIVVLVQAYRENKFRRATPHSANSWCWDATGSGRIVAYKLIKKAES